MMRRAIAVKATAIAAVVALTAPLMIATAQGQELPRAPGAKGPEGTVSQSSSTSGTTTNYGVSAPATEAPWPCAQRKVETISAGTIWSGPDVAQGADWEGDRKVAQLAQKLASRRTELTEAESAINDFARDAGTDKDKQLTKLFVGVLDIINENRNRILRGISRYATGQARLAERLRDESDKISQTQNEPNLNFMAGKPGAVSEYEWDQRIFKERRQALSYVCETPSLLERRAFEIGRRIQAQL